MKKLTAEIKAEIVDEYRKGVKSEYLASLFGVTPGYIRTLAKRAGIPPRSEIAGQLRRMVAMQDKVFK